MTISLSGLGKSYGSQTLFRGGALQFVPGGRYGIVGANGSGKSTLLRIMTGEEEATEGEVGIPRKLRVGFLRQDQFELDAEPILHVAMMGYRELWDAIREKERLLENAGDDFDVERYGELEDLILQHDGYGLDARAAEILEGLNIPNAVHREPLSTLSGGFKLRVLLGQALAAEPDVLLLDEPTNHLDILSIRWLEKFITGFKGIVLVVSHDHRFLNNVCTHVVDVDYERLTLYRGNYNDFQRQKREDRERMEAEIAKREQQIADHKTFVERFKAKPTKARQAKSKAKQIERIVIEDLPRSSRQYPRFDLKARRPSGKQVVEVRGVSKAFGENRVLDDVSLRVMRGDRLAIIGPNGIGKSTLLNIMVDRLSADAGEVEWGYEAHPGFFAQDSRELVGDGGATVQSWLWDACPAESIGFVRGRLARVLFTKDDAQKRVRNLSGGEAARLVFARLGVEQPTVLVLDEPTNHLDLEGIESLAEALPAYDGTLIFVSHDRWFVSQVATRILEITPEGIDDFPGTYDEYLAHCGDDHLDVDAAVRRARRERARIRDGAG